MPPILSPAGTQRLFVTGATGLIGSHVITVARDDWHIVAPSSNELDIRDAEAVNSWVSSSAPDVVLHLAYRRTDSEVIVDGSRNIARAATAVGARLIHLSTDLVFAGRGQPYTELDRPDARLEYGRHKLAAEYAVAAAHPEALIVRTSLVYSLDADGPVLRDIAAAITGTSTMAFFDDEVRCPVAAVDLASCLLRLAKHRVTGRLHLAGPEAVSRADLARTAARWLGFDPALVPVSSIAESGLDRPGSVVLDSSRAARLGFAVRPVSDVLA